MVSMVWSKNNTTTLAAFCVKLQPCTFWDNARLDMCTPNPANQNDAMISNAPCIMTDGVGLYFLIAAKNTDSIFHRTHSVNRKV